MKPTTKLSLIQAKPQPQPYPYPFIIPKRENHKNNYEVVAVAVGIS